MLKGKQVLGKIKGCIDESPLQAVACTKRCERRQVCKLKRTPFLINTLNVKGTFHKATRIGGIPTTQFKIISMQTDHYINEILEDDENHG